MVGAKFTIFRLVSYVVILGLVRKHLNAVGALARVALRLYLDESQESGWRRLFHYLGGLKSELITNCYQLHANSDR